MIVRKVARVAAMTNVAVVSVGLVVLALLPKAGSDRDTRTAMRPPAKKVELPAATLPPPVAATVESARKAGANELGLVPVIMYHRILAHRIAPLDRTPDQLRGELERLAKDHYVPITAGEFVRGDINIPAGTHPVVLTFDDGWPSHFATDAQGMPLNDTAVGIIYQVAMKYPSFRPVATFWVNRRPFGLKHEADQARAVKWLTEHGFEVANHTWAHADLHVLKTKQVKEQIVRESRLLRQIGAPPSPAFALPYGALPKKLSVAHDGSWDGTSYHFDGVFLAGAEPSISPYAKDFKRYAIPRIQSNGMKGECSHWCSTYWLGWLDKHPAERYTADGDPNHVSLPKALQGNITPKRAKMVIAY